MDWRGLAPEGGGRVRSRRARGLGNSVDDSMNLALDYGADATFVWTPTAGQVDIQHGGPDAPAERGEPLARQLAQPLEFPPLASCVVPGDKVVLALDRRVAGAPQLVADVWRVLSQAEVAPQDVCILQPAALLREDLPDPRTALEPAVRDAMQWKIHDPTRDDACGYLASSAAGERVYLSRELLNADFVLPVVRAGFDPVLGYRVPASVFYPGLSNTAAFAKMQGLGHSELQPEDDRPIRQLVEEIGWLLGVQFAIHTLPTHGRAAPAAVLAGSVESVSRQAQQRLDREWRLKLPSRHDTVVAAVPTDAGPASWDQVAAALSAAQHLVTRGGRIVLLTDIAAAPGPGVEMIRAGASARAALQPLRQQNPPDQIAATRIASAADWATIYLLSRLDGALVEELFLTPLENEQEGRRLLEFADNVVVLSAAHETHTEIDAA